MDRKSWFFTAVVLVLTLVAVTLPPLTQAGEISHFRGDSADASFSSTDGCVITGMFVFTSDAIFQNPPGSPNPSSAAIIGISQVDTCTSIVLLLAFSGFVSLADSDFQVAGNLRSATLNATIPVSDSVSGSSFDVVVNLTWTGTGDVGRGNSHNHVQAPGFIINTHSNGTSRSAQAVGSVSDGVTNFTPAPSEFADLLSTKSGTVEIN